MPEFVKHVVLTCDALAAEATHALARIGRSDVPVMTFAVDCEADRLSWAALQKLIDRTAPEAKVLGAAGHCTLRLGPPPTDFGKRWRPMADSCIDLLLGEGVEEQAASKGIAFLAPGWLKSRGDRSSPHFCSRRVEGCSRLVELEAGVHPAQDEAPLRTYAGELGVRAEQQPIGLELLGYHLRHELDGPATDRSRAAATTETPSSDARAANYALALEVMGQLGDRADEAAAIDGVFDFFELLCAPGRLRWRSLGEGSTGRQLERCAGRTSQREISADAQSQHSADHGSTAEGFWLRVGRSSQPLGCLEVLELAHPERRDEYLGVALGIERVMAMAVETARQSERRRRAEAALAAEAERLAVTLHSIGDGVIATDELGQITLINGVAAQLTGVTPEDARGQPLVDVFHIINEHTREVCESPLRRVLDQGLIVGLANSTALLSADGSEYLIADSGAPIRNAQGHILGAVLVFRDVTEQIRLEREATRGAKLASVAQLAGGIAHDFNNLLAAIMGNLSIARDALGGAPEDVCELLEAAERGARDSAKLTKQLLTFAQGGAPVLEVLSLTELLGELTPFVLRGSNARPRLLVADDLWSVEADRGQIGQVLTNLLVNATEAMPTGGDVEVVAENATLGAKMLPLPEGRYVRITVRDEGEGIAPELLARIFDPFFTSKASGTGLGLATVYSIVQRHGGHIGVVSRLGQGATFTIHLPAVDTPLRKPLPHPRTSLPRVPPQRVLVMDDDEYLRRIYQRALQTLGHEATITEDGRAALEAFQAAWASDEPYQLLILDLTVPGGVGGLQVIETVRALDSDVKAIVASGYSDDGAMARARQSGFDAVLPKPFTLRDLERCIAELLAPPTERFTTAE